MKKNSLEQKRKQYNAVVEEEKLRMAKSLRKQANRAAAAKTAEPVDTDSKMKFRRGKKLPRREYKAARHHARRVKYAPRILSSDNGDIDMAVDSKLPIKAKVSKTLRLVKDKDSIAK
jgi:hypothetical protein